jgi:hypothetical protein
MTQETILMIILLPAVGGMFAWYFIDLWDEWRNK